MNLTVLGAGAWGTALAVSTAARHATLLWSRDAEQALRMQSARENRRYLPGVALPEALHIDIDFDKAVAHGRDGLIVIATPMAGLHEMLQRLPDTSAGVLWLCKGFQEGTGLLGHEVARAARPGAANVGILSGPSFALEVARGQPAALVAASADEALCQLAVEAFHSDSLRIYASSDPVGVEVGGAVKNVMAIATGIADGMQLGLNARAALITRGLAEIARVGVAFGAHPLTFAGLSGMGDLVLTCAGDMSRNRQVGLELARGKKIDQIVADMRMVAEGVKTTRVARQLAATVGVEVPLTEFMYGIMYEGRSPSDGITDLMTRAPRHERD